MPRFAANVSLMFNEHPFLERIKAAADAGFQAVECQFPYHVDAIDLADACGTAGVKLALMNAPPGDWNAGERGLAALPGREQDFRDSIDVAFEYAELAEAERIARVVTDELGGAGLFGVELFVRGNEVWFSEVSPRPHDTGLVTLISQDLSEFALHARAILGLPVPAIRAQGPAASCAVLLEGRSRDVRFHGVERALAEPGTQLRLFGKPEVSGRRRMGVTLALGADLEDARDKARRAAAAIVAGAELR